MEKHILITGLTSVRLGTMENSNIGNYLIIEPLFSKMREYFPDAIIKTTLQLSSDFSKRYDIIILQNPRFWTYKFRTLFLSLTDILKVGITKLLKTKSLINSSILLKEINWADLVIDFSGDLYGDNSPINRFIEGSIKLLLSHWLEKPVIMLASSPGPFKKNFLYKMVGKYTINKVDIIANREPRSSKYLINLGIDKEKIITTACPSILFNKESSASLEKIYLNEKIDGQKEKVGLIISGWNMPMPPFNKVPRSEKEIDKFLPIIEFFIKNNLQVILLSHSNRIDKKGNISEGPDSLLCKQIISEYQKKFEFSMNLKMVKNIYNPETIRKIIGDFDFLISGRLHAAISGLSQNVPTVIIDYGFEPKGHKLLGIAELFGIEEYFCDPNDPDEMYRKIYKAWENRNLLKETISKNLIHAKELALLNFKIVNQVLEKQINAYKEQNNRNIR